MKPIPGWTASARWTAGWAAVTLALWLAGRAVGDRPSLLVCAVGAVLTIVGGELGDRRRGRRARNRAARRRAGTGGSAR
ncbi:hypothetical protein NFX46_02475 [Streptomyces phaeoluteigriseus]|uniref:Uncharacterized protein n=1 Tax=Streptomyces phaeoluteigriseus TaxID=114686 RepID=A0ABY4Z104_9ACTN|nr:hypothetical protein [Streptomyces phaeoluteigriseus]USQ82733.1 hypothetical protein NFX46_02475 [Streptomyces phaeoluteigriseus]